MIAASRGTLIALSRVKAKRAEGRRDTVCSRWPWVAVPRAQRVQRRGPAGAHAVGPVAGGRGQISGGCFLVRRYDFCHRRLGDIGLLGRKLRSSERACVRSPFWAGTLPHLQGDSLMALDSDPLPRPRPPGCLLCKRPWNTRPSACQHRGNQRSLGNCLPTSPCGGVSFAGRGGQGRGLASPPPGPPRTQVPENS